MATTRGSKTHSPKKVQHPPGYREINRAIGKAQQTYSMISDGDRICVGVSGGKDSLTLLWFLKERLERIPIKYSLVACHVDPGFEGGFADDLKAFCESNGWELMVERTDCGVVAHSDENHENPCFLCSRLRRKRLFEVCAEKGCNKLALGHHKDDIIESLFLSMFYAGEMSLMKPFVPMFGGKVAIIRPLAFADESDIKRFVKHAGFPVFKNNCPSANSSKRSEIRKMLSALYRENRKVRGNIFRAIRNIKEDYLL